MFKVPDWGNDIPKSDVDVNKIFGNKTKKKTAKNKNTIKTKNNQLNIGKASNQKNNINGTGKAKKKFVKKVNGYKKLTKEDHINNRILKRNLKETSAEVKSNNTSATENAKNNLTKKSKSVLMTYDVNNKMKNKILKRKQKLKKESKPKNSNENKVIQSEDNNSDTSKNLSRKRKNNGSFMNATKENGIDIQNFNTDEPDKALVNAKRKKLNDKIKSDDVEDVLFGTKENSDMESSNKEKNTTVSRKNYVKAPPCETENDSEEQTAPSIKDQKIQKKKEMIKKVLKQDSNRNVINTNGNKLRTRMLERLKAAQFRYLNEKLYTSSGSESQELFKSDPAAFQIYHEGYQLQVKKWPINPLDLIVKRIQKMPKTHVIADMGCGEAALSRRVPQQVHSFDLVARDGVVACDMAHTPLNTASVNVVVYCLALMGTDLTQYLLEANRVLKTGGHLLIAEVESRFDNPETFSSDVQRLGFSLKNLDKTHKVFLFMEFNKVRDAPSKKNKLPALSLKPCLYKRR